MSSEFYPSQIIMRRYFPVRDIPSVYNIEESVVLALVEKNKVHYSKFRDPRGHRRILHVDMLDVLNILGMEPKILHLEGGYGESI